MHNGLQHAHQTADVYMQQPPAYEMMEPNFDRDTEMAIVAGPNGGCSSSKVVVPPSSNGVRRPYASGNSTASNASSNGNNGHNNNPEYSPPDLNSQASTLSPPDKAKLRFSPDVNWEIRDRANTWPKRPPEEPQPPPPQDEPMMRSPAAVKPDPGTQLASTSYRTSAQGSLTSPYGSHESVDTQGETPLTTSIVTATGGRRNPWGNQSYSDLITSAINSSPDKRLTLAQIYEWMIKNIPYFAERADTTSAAGWKNSVRHNLSLHSRFVRVQNEEAGKSSWWTCSPTPAQSGETSAAQPTTAGLHHNSSQNLYQPCSSTASGLDHPPSQRRAQRRRATVETANHSMLNARNRVRAKLAAMASGGRDDATRYLDPLQIEMLNGEDTCSLKRARSSMSESKQNNTFGSNSPASPNDFEPNCTLMPPQMFHNQQSSPQLNELITSAHQLQLHTSPHSSTSSRQISPAAASYVKLETLPQQQQPPPPQQQSQHPMLFNSRDPNMMMAAQPTPPSMQNDILAASTASMEEGGYFPNNPHMPCPSSFNEIVETNTMDEVVDTSLGDLDNLCAAVASPSWQTGEHVTCDVNEVIRRELQLQQTPQQQQQQGVANNNISQRNGNHNNQKTMFAFGKAAIAHP